MLAAEDGDESMIDGLLLADDHLMNLGADHGQRLLHLFESHDETFRERMAARSSS